MKNFFAFLAASFGLAAGVWMVILVGQGCYYKCHISPLTWEENVQFVDAFAEVFLPYGYMALALMVMALFAVFVYNKLDAKSYKISQG